MNASVPFPFNWKQPAGQALELALNRALALDPATRTALATLDGRRIALRLDAPPLALQVQVQGDRLRVGPVPEDGAPDLSVRSTLGGLLAQIPWLRPDSGAAPPGRLRIEGDAELAQQLQKLARRFDPDWERPFASVFGDVLGVQVARAVATGLRQARTASAEGAQVLGEYLTEEAREVVSRDELNAFFDDVDALRDAVERLAARIDQLQADRAP